MIKRRAIAVATATCWAGATTGIFFDWPPGEKAHSYLLAVGVALFVWLRTSTDDRQDMSRSAATMFYQMGVIHALKGQDAEGEARATVHRLAGRRTGTGRGGGAAATVLFAGVALVALVAATAVSDAMERASAPEAGPAQVHSPPAESPVITVTSTPKRFRTEPVAGCDEPRRTPPRRSATSAPVPSRAGGTARTAPAGPPPAGTATRSQTPEPPPQSQTPTVVDTPDLLVTTTAR